MESISWPAVICYLCVWGYLSTSILGQNWVAGPWWKFIYHWLHYLCTRPYPPNALLNIDLIITSLKRENYHNADFVINGGTAGCRYYNLRCHQWRYHGFQRWKYHLEVIFTISSRSVSSLLTCLLFASNVIHSTNMGSILSSDISKTHSRIRAWIRNYI